MLLETLSSLALVVLEDAPEAAKKTPSMLPVFVAIAAIFWFVMILPERKNRKKRENLLAELKKGDKVMMKSGLYGSIADLREDLVTLQVADGVRMKFAREAIQGLADENAKPSGKQDGKQDGKQKDKKDEKKDDAKLLAK